MGNKPAWVESLVTKAIQKHYEAPDGVTFRDMIAETIQMGVDYERDRCRRIANRYEKGPEERAKLAGTIREQIESGVEY